MELKERDGVEFIVVHNPRTQECNARKLVRISEAPEETAPRRYKGLNKEHEAQVRAAERPKPQMPDWTMGFQFGRGKAIGPGV